MPRGSAGKCWPARRRYAALGTTGHFLPLSKVGLGSRFTEAEMLPVAKQMFGPDNERTLRTVNNLATALGGQDKNAEPEPMYHEA